MEIKKNKPIRKALVFFALVLTCQFSFSQEASDFCESAPLFCSFNNYHGSVTSDFTAIHSPSDTTDEDDLPLTNVFCGSMENNGWFRFTAVDTTMTLDVETYNCTHGNGIQMEVYETFDCYNFTSMSNCENSGIQTNFQIIANNLVPGQIYYIMVDGQAGDLCEYTINGIAGFPDLPSGPDDTVCLGHTVELSASGGLAYHWYPDDGLDNTEIPNPTAIIWDTTSYMVEIYASDPICLMDVDTVTLYPEYCDECIAHAGLSDTSCGLNYSGLNASYVPEFSFAQWSCSDTTLHFEYPGLFNTPLTAEDTGTYEIVWTVADSYGNYCSDTIFITFTGTLSLTTSGVNESAFEACDGEATAIASNGTPPYEYYWTEAESWLQTITDLCSGTYEVIVTDAMGCAISDTVIISYPETVLTVQNRDFSFYPNPVKDMMTFENHSAEKATVEFRDITGKTLLIKQIEPGTALIDLSNLKKGIYIVSIINNMKLYNMKMLRE